MVYNKIVSEINEIESLKDEPEKKSMKIQNLPTESLFQSILTAFNEVKKSSISLSDAVKETKGNEDEILSYD